MLHVDTALLHISIIASPCHPEKRSDEGSGCTVALPGHFILPDRPDPSLKLWMTGAGSVEEPFHKRRENNCAIGHSKRMKTNAVFCIPK
jgi:hypothetical protein